MEQQKKQVTKGIYKLIVWSSIIVGLIFNAIFYYILTMHKIGTSNLQLVGWLALSCIVVGFGVGLAYSRSLKIEGIDK